MDQKICPILYSSFLCFKGHTDEQNLSEITCLQDQCEWWDPEEKRCVIFAVIKAIAAKD